MSAQDNLLVRGRILLERAIDQLPLYLGLRPDEQDPIGSASRNRAFQFLGGLPWSVRIDNLKTAVAQGGGPWAVLNSTYTSYAQQLGTWVWTSVAGSNKKSVEDSALTGCRQMASKEGIAGPCLIY